MTMVSSGPISLGGNATTGGLNQSINIELGQSATATISLNDSNVRTLLAKTGAGTTISLNDAYGKANQFAFTISSNQTNANLRTLAVSAGWNQSSKVVATISGGVIISSNSTGTPALTVNGSFPGGVELINNGTIVGMGGNGGKGGCDNTTRQGAAGAGGGTALSVSVATTVTNNGTIAGGGGGGGGGGSGGFDYGGKIGWIDLSGGGGGGGRSSNAANSSAGGSYNVGAGYTGGTGSSGTYSAAGGGGSGGFWNGGTQGGAGGSGGGWGSSGASGGSRIGGSPANPRGNSGPFSGGAAGAAAVSGGLITWAATGTRFGGVS